MRRVVTQMNATNTMAALMVASDGSTSTSGVTSGVTSASESTSMTSTGSGVASGFAFLAGGTGGSISCRFAGGEGAPLPVLSVGLDGAPGGVLSSGFFITFSGEEKEEEEEEEAVCSITLPPMNCWIRAIDILVVVVVLVAVRYNVVRCGVVLVGWLRACVRACVRVCVCLFVCLVVCLCVLVGWVGGSGEEERKSRECDLFYTEQNRKHGYSTQNKQNRKHERTF